jgi:DNA replication protein DnaC
LAARDASNVVNRLKAAGFPVTKTLEAFDVATSSIQPKVFDYLSSLEWIRTQQNLAIIGPAGTGKSHTLIGLGVAAIHAGHKVRYFTAADLVETLYRGLADNTVGKIIESLLRVDLIILDLSRPRDYAEEAECFRGKPLGSELLLGSNLSDCSA